MKTIILFRHGKASNDYYSLDHNRPLSLAGIKQAKKVGINLARNNEMPDLVISSTALRAQTTAEIAMKAGEWPCTIQFDRGIYSGALQFIFKLVKSQNNSLSSICIVGHEPNISNFINQTTSDKCQKFLPASMARIDFDVNLWNNISMGLGNLIWILHTKEF